MHCFQKPQMRNAVRSCAKARAWPARWICFAAVLACGLADDCFAEPITVRLKSGRTFTAEADAKSDERLLWLRFDRDGVALLRPIEWTAIVELRRGDTQLSPMEFRATMVQRLALPPNSRELSLPKVVEAAKPIGGGSLQSWRVPGRNGTDIPQEFPPIRSIHVDAYLANWDADVEADGLSLTLEALDSTGTNVPVSGVLQVELVGERYPPLTRGNAFPVLGRWTRQVNYDDFSFGGVLRTQHEFQALHPEYQLWLSRYALVHVRLVVPGQGTFETSVDAVALRGFTPVRERLQQAFGTRFLPTEATGRGHRETSVYVP